MTQWTAAKRKALDKKWFGDPTRSLYPVQDQSDLDDAAKLIGKAADPEAVKARLIKIGKDLGLSIPDAWQEKAKATMALLAVALGSASAVADTAPGMVRRTALITKAGEYPANKWAITPAELKASAERFAGNGYVEIEHFKSLTPGKTSILDGQTGYVDGTWSSEDGEEMWGDLVLPEWLNEIADANGGKVSAVFEPESKDLVGVGLVMEPAVPEAAMLSAMVIGLAARHDTPQGQYAMQRIHDTAVTHGATCSQGNVTMASKHEASAIQQAHDLAVDHGAKCDAVGARGGGSMMFSKHEQSGQEQGQEGQAVPQEKTVAELQAQLEAEKAQREADRKALVTLQAERRVEKAETFVDRLITENKVLPAERDLLVKMHVQAATDDDMVGLVTLSEGKVESRLVTVVAALSARQVIGLTREQIAANPNVTVLLNRQQTEDQAQAGRPTQEEKDKALAMTPLGRQALAARQRRAAGGQ